MVKIERVPPAAVGRIAMLRNVFEGEEDVLVAYLFGSRARGDAGPMSDIDLAVLLQTGADGCAIGGRAHLTLLHVVAAALGTGEVDLVLLNAAPLTVAYRVVLEGKLLFCRDECRRVLFEEETTRRYLDTAFLRREYSGRFLKRLLEGRLGE